MKPPRLLVAAVVGCAFASASLQATGFYLQLSFSDQRVQLTLPSAVQAPSGAITPEYTIERSSDLQTWTPIGGKVRALAGRPGPLLNITVADVPAPVFYRARANLGPIAITQTASGGADVFGFSSELASELQRIGFLSQGEFSNAYSPPEYLPAVGFDPTTAQYWTNFNTDPVAWNQGLPTDSPDRPLYDFRLAPAELALFYTNGFVVTERLGAPSFGDAYYKIFTEDLPVFITSDSILHAWHRSYVNMLSEMEEVQLATLVEKLITNMTAGLPAAWSEYGGGDLRTSLLDADYFLTVARSLWFDRQVPCVLSDQPQDGKVLATLTAITNLHSVDFNLFGRTPNAVRRVDFSQFKVRGHYDTTDRLRRYFRTVMWLGRIDMRIAESDEDTLVQLGLAVILNDLLTRSDQYGTWSQLDEVTRAFVGPTDSLTFEGLGGLLRAEGIVSPAELTWDKLEDLQTRVQTGELGVQAIIGDTFFSPLGSEQLKLPRSFTVLGQKFVTDSWAMSQVVFDRVLWPADGSGVPQKVIRRKPSGVDVAFSVFANDHTTPVLLERIASTDGVPFRDGQPYQHNLAAVRNVLDAGGTDWWTNNVYSSWLYALRSLSAPSMDPLLPEAMRTRAWAMKGLNTQLASWTQLRHNSVLYAKQSYTPPILCDYPQGFVEPIPEFWERMELLARVTAASLSKLSLSGLVQLPPKGLGDSGQYDLRSLQLHQVSFCNHFIGRMQTLHSLARKELASIPFSTEDNEFVRSVVEWVFTYVGKRQYTGWYPGLFYAPISSGYAFQEDDGCGKWDPLVIDVHTDVPDPLVGDPGAVIHEAVGNVNMMVIAVDNGPDRTVYAGPVFSYYEFELPADTRMSDAEWQQRLQSSPPPAPEWTVLYMAKP